MLVFKCFIVYNYRVWQVIFIKNISPYIKICFTFALVILIGALLLMLPISTNPGYETLNFVDALFMSTTSVCVTGLTVVPNIGAQISIFGKVVLALLIEIGGLSFITIATFFIVMMGGKIGISNRFLLRESLNQNSLKGIVGLIKKIIFTSLTIQAFGFILNCLAFMSYSPDPWTTIGVGLFHTVASFNNSGLDIFGDLNVVGNLSMIPFSADVFVNVNTILLIVFGGLGFGVIDDIIHTHNIKRFNINTKIVLITTILLIFGGALFIKISNNARTWLECFLMSVSSRTAGFQSIQCADLNSGEFCVINFLMFVGASPGSTGGGIKTSTFFVIVVTIIAIALGKKPVVFKREISHSIIVKSLALAITAIIFCCLAIFFIAIMDPNLEIRKIIFEVISAFSTTGLSMGITGDLSVGSELIIIFMMYFGRLGPLTILSLINRNWRTGSENGIKYVEEKVVIG